MLTFVARLGGVVCTLIVCASAATFSGRVVDPQGQPVARASITIDSQTIESNADGTFSVDVGSAPSYTVVASAPGFADVRENIVVSVNVEVRFRKLSNQHESVTVTADAKKADVLSPDPGQRVFVRQDMLDANPGRPGAPVSIPGLPVETASGGIKAPQYFSPGVAGDHGEPIASYFQVGSYPVPNNLSANAHGNGYSDPNAIIPAMIESVEVDGGAFNVREGNHAVDLAATYGFRSRLDPFVAVSADYRDMD